MFCSDINECDLSTGGVNDCDDKAECINFPGSFDCTCTAGYSGDGRFCEDLDECGIPNQCELNADCVNTAGSYECVCKDGFFGDGVNCTSEVY